MEIVLVSLFVLGYLAITLEHTIKMDKLIPALSMMAVLWAVVSIYHLPVFEGRYYIKTTNTFSY